jgi:4-aminobutyrate aminotransferase-like enzyme
VIELSERLSALAPAGLSHAFYASDGASATEIALKMSFHCWRQGGTQDKHHYARLAGGYHGETVGALGVTDIALFRDAYGPLLRGHPLLPSPAPRDAVDDRARDPQAEDDRAPEREEHGRHREGRTRARPHVQHQRDQREEVAEGGEDGVGRALADVGLLGESRNKVATRDGSHKNS